MICKSSARLTKPAAPRWVRGVLTLAVAGALGACSLFGLGSRENDSYDYRNAHSRLGPLEVPPDLSPLPRDEHSAVPGSAGAGAAAAVGQPSSSGAAGGAGATGIGPVAAAGTATAAAAGTALVSVAPTAPNARIVREGSQRWLAVDVAPEQAYAAVKQFLVSQGFTIEREEPTLGIIETAWGERHPKIHEDAIRTMLGKVFRDMDTIGEQDKFRARIERTPANTSEIYVTHRGLIEVATGVNNESTRWNPRPPDPGAEAEMLQMLLLQFAPATTAGAQLAAAATGTVAAAPAGASAAPPAVARAAAAPVETTVSGTKVQKTTLEGFPALQVDEPFDHAWRRIGLALDRGGFTVEDRDRTKGLYFVRYLDPDYEAAERAKRGLFARIFNSDAKVTAQQFRVALATRDAGTAVKVLDKDGKPDASATADRILNQISEQLK
jgi:outer membrane protein assembly factor BamC